MATDFNTQVIEEFRANDGKVGGMFEGAPMILVNTTGAKSGQTRTIPLMYYQEGDDRYIIASAAGSTKHPAWYFNLKANPEVTVEIGNDTLPVTVTELSPDRRSDVWPRLVALMPQFGEYEKTTDGRIIPLLEVTPR